jgi:hypothetical protein
VRLELILSDPPLHLPISSSVSVIKFVSSELEIVKDDSHLLIRVLYEDISTIGLRGIIRGESRGVEIPLLFARTIIGEVASIRGLGSWNPIFCRMHKMS